MDQASLKPPTTFFSLPAEIRNTIYKLSRCLMTHQCRHCLQLLKGDPHQFYGVLGYRLCCRTCCTNCRSRLATHDNKVTSMSLWVNRSSRLTVQDHEDPKAPAYSSGVRCARVTHGRSEIRCKAWDHGAEHVSGVAQPALTEVSKQVRSETLPIFYGNPSFLFTVTDTEIDGAAIRKYFELIGKESAGLLRDVKIVCRSKENFKYVDKELKPELEKLGVKLDANVLTMKRLKYPFCYCENCIRKLIGEA